MRTFFIAATALTLAACATQEAAKPVPAPAAASAAKPTPQCYSGDHGKFFNVGEQTKISGVEVTCQATSDGKNGQWMGRKH